MVEMRRIIMPAIKYIVPGIPIPLQRPRYNGGMKPYDAQKLQKHAWRNYIEDQHGNMPFFDGAVRLDVILAFPIPKTSLIHAEFLRHTYHHFRPDTSNCLKFIEDCCNGITYKDDCIIAEIHIVKIYADEPRTEFTITPLPKGMKVIVARRVSPVLVQRIIIRS